MIKAEDAIAKINRHVNGIERKLKRKLKKSLADVSSQELLENAYDFMHRSKEFKDFRPYENGEFTYSHYELGHNIIKKIVIARLVNDGKLTSQNAPLLGKFLGYFHGNAAPQRLQEEKLTSLLELEKRLGKDETRELVVRASDYWGKIGRDIATAHHKLARPIALNAQGTFLNPTVHYLIHPAYPKDTETYDKLKAHLAKLIAQPLSHTPLYV